MGNKGYFLDASVARDDFGEESGKVSRDKYSVDEVPLLSRYGSAITQISPERDAGLRGAPRSASEALPRHKINVTNR